MIHPARRNQKFQWISWLGCYTYLETDYETIVRCDAAESAYDSYREELKHRALTLEEFKLECIDANVALSCVTNPERWDAPLTPINRYPFHPFMCVCSDCRGLD